mgnify:CR=1 FL=1|jgi:hypothetical protein|tara:strand:- start:352 stop:1692 length:1341 start_codon:yes stop_codon:yes gene_type:complete
MATHDYVLANQSGSSFRSDLNNALAAIVSQNSSATEPATKYAYQYWIDTSATPALIKQRNAANDAWITLAEVDGQTLAADGTNAKPGISFAADINCGLKRNAADDISIVTGGTQAITVDSSQRVGIGTTSPAAVVHLEGAAPYIRTKQTSAPTDEKTWDFNAGTDGIFRFRNTNDAANSSNNWLEVERNGVQTNSIRLLTGSGSERVRITSGGFVGIGTTSPATALHISGTTSTSSRIQLTRSGVDGQMAITGNALAFDSQGSSGTNGTIQFYAGGTKRTEILTDGRLVLGGITPNTSVDNSLVCAGRIESDGTYSITTSGSANLHVGSNGTFSRSTSSRKYKANIETMEDSYADAILNARPVWFNSTAPEDTDHPEWGYWGFIAEEMHDIDPRLVFYGRPNEEGNLEPEGVQYDRFVPHLVNLIKRQKDQIVDLTARIEALEAAS